jgi:hypothetical protein
MLDGNGKRWIIVGDYAGYAHRWQYGNDDDGTTISAYHTTPRLKIKKGDMSQDFSVIMSMKAISDDTVNFQYRSNYNDTWSTAKTVNLYNPTGESYLVASAGDSRRDFVLNTATLGPDKVVVEDEIGLDTQGNNIQFKISDSLTTGPWTLYSYLLKGRKLASVRHEG